MENVCKNLENQKFVWAALASLRQICGASSNLQGFPGAVTPCWTFTWCNDEVVQVDVDARVTRPSADADDSDDEVFYDCDPSAAAAAQSSSSNRAPYEDGQQSGAARADQGSFPMQPGAGNMGDEQGHSNHAAHESQGHAQGEQHGGLPPGPIRMPDG